ncbi:unnamed protein product [Brugia timori]|uniref:Uncharacterized protein n=1 Tax=Brugia timori TaxID=42155 RepID=A0A3P7TYR6_9BILA|nr:unnamed protein product [Brugia timori]
MNIPVQILDRCISLDPTPSKRFCPFRAFLTMDKQTSQLEVITPEAAARQLGTSLHTIAFSETIEVGHVNWKFLASKLKLYDSNLQVKEDGIEMFDGEITLTSVTDYPKHVEITWDEIREEWSEEIINALREEVLSL